MVNKVYVSFTNFIADDLKASKAIFTLIWIAFFAFTLFAANVPLAGGVPHRLLNALPSGTAFIMLLYVTLFKTSRSQRQLLLLALIYEINIIDGYLLYATQHMDMYAYQFIVTNVLSSYFFHTRRSLFYFWVTVNCCVVATAFSSYAKSSGPVDFYMTYFSCQVVYGILFKYRFSVEERLLESEKKYRLLAENSFDIICVHDEKAKLQFISPSVTRVLGYKPDELIGKFPIDFTYQEDTQLMMSVNFRDPDKLFLNTPRQYRFRSADGRIVWMETIFTLIDSEEPGSGYILSQSREISKRKEYQNALEERTRELERSNADLETFAFVSSHDMQEPLRMISNYTQLLKRKYAGKLDQEAEEYIDFANKGAVHLQQLIRDLLSYSRITRTDVKRAPLNMNALMDEVMKNIRMEVEEKNALILYDDLQSLPGDKNLIMLVMQNLVLNGVKYNQSEKPTVRISCSTAGREITFCIEDNGIGIDKRHQQRIFEPFHRLHTKSEYPGTGLGLSICKKIIEKSNGRIWLESEPNKGTRFYFSLS